MSGHSKWSKIKHQKGATDAAKGKIFTKLANLIAMAVREGEGTDPATNMKLRFAVDKARAANMPKEKIERAVARGAGSAGDSHVSYIMYEAFGPGGVGFIIEAVTDNKLRTIAAVKNVLDRGGGVLAGMGAVSYLFDFVGLVIIAKNAFDFDHIFELAIACDVLDIEDGEDSVALFCKPTMVHATKEYMEKNGCTVDTAELWYRPKSRTPADEAITSSAERLSDALEDLDDVQRVFTTV